MPATVKKLPRSLIEITITVPYSDYSKAEKTAILEIGKEMKIDGFRSGHVPEDVVREKTSADTIRGVTLEHIIPPSYAKAVKENDLLVISQPKVDIKTPVTKEGEDLVYVATVSVMPEVKLGDYKKIKVKMKEVKVSKKEIDETIEMLMSRFAEWKEVDRKSKEGDRVELTFEGVDEKGEVIANTASKNHPVVLGSKSMIPGFEEAVVGMTAGEDKEFDITFPKDYHAKQMQNRKVKFKTKLGRIEEKTEQKLDSSMIEKIIGKKQSVDEFKQRIEDDLEAEMKQRAQTEVDNKVVSEIVKITEADLPDSLIDDEIELLKNERKQQIARQWITWEQYLTHVKKTEEDFAKDHRKGARDRLLARLAVNQIIKNENIKVSEDEADKKIEEMSVNYSGEEKQKFMDHFKKGSKNYHQLQNNLSADKLIKMFVS